MPKVKINKSSSLDPKQAFERVTSLLNEDKELRKLDPKYECQFDAENLTGTANGGQFKADMKITESDAGSEVELIVELPFHLAMVKGLVQKTLDKKLDEILG